VELNLRNGSLRSGEEYAFHSISEYLLMIAAGAAAAALAPVVLPLVGQAAGMAADVAKQALGAVSNFAGSAMNQQQQIKF
jgi:hypothetical protein